MENGKTSKKKDILKNVLKAEISPLLIGLRNEIADLAKEIKRQEKAKPKIQKSEITNPQKFPETQKTEEVNPIKEVTVTNPQERVQVKGIKGLFGNLYNKIAQQTDFLGKSIKEIKTHVFKVQVENQKNVKFPDVQKVEVTNPQKQEGVQRVKIENTQPSEAVPVVLTEKGKKRFYDILFQVTGGSNLSKLKQKLDDIKVVLENLEVTIEAGDIQIGAVEIKDGDSDTRLDVEQDSTKNAAYVQSESLTQEATLLLVKSELTAIKGFVDGIEGLLASLDGKDFATETTLSAIEGFVDGIEGLLVSIDSKDFATETTLSAIEAQTTKLTFLVDRLKVDAAFSTGKTPKSAKIDVSASGDNTIVASVVGKKIKVNAFAIQAIGTVNTKWKDGASTDLTGAFNWQAREGLANAIEVPSSLFETSVGNALVLNLSAAVQVVGWVSYWDDDAS